MIMKRTMLFVLLIILTTACSGEEDASEETETSTEETSEEKGDAEEMDGSGAENVSAEMEEFGDLERFATDDMAEMLHAEPGQFDAEADQDIIVEIMEEAIAAGMEGEELFFALLDLGAGDLREYQTYMDEFEAVFSDTPDRPDGDSDEDAEGQEQEINVQVLFDASGSMAEEMDGSTKMDLAKDAVEDFVSQVPEEANISLRVYGHEGSNQAEDKEESCAGTEEVYPLSPYDEEAFTEALDQFEPTGYTPLGASIEAAQEDLEGEEGENVENIVYVVSDGEETCGGDPAQASEALNDSGIEAVVNIIGFDVSNEEREALMDIAEAGHGEYLSADSGEELEQVLLEQREEIIREWGEWYDEHEEMTSEEFWDFYDDMEAKFITANESYSDEFDHLLAIVEQLHANTDADTIALLDGIYHRTAAIHQHVMNQTAESFSEEVMDQAYEITVSLVEETAEEIRTELDEAEEEQLKRELEQERQELREEIEAGYENWQEEIEDELETVDEDIEEGLADLEQLREQIRDD